MWFQIQLPQIMNLSELQFITPPMMRFGPPPPRPQGTNAAAAPNQPRPAAGAPQGAPPQIRTSTTFPKGYSIETSLNGNDWTIVDANMKGADGENSITFNNSKAKYIRLTLTDPTSRPNEVIPWSMRQLKLFVLKP